MLNPRAAKEVQALHEWAGGSSILHPNRLALDGRKS
jgi:hypothetical protein